ncbi:MAG: arylsulfatase A-like enzyme, partial [Rhodothermales bacterium]
WTVGGKAIDFDDSDITIAKELKRAGYATGLFGKWGLDENVDAGTGHPLKQGFDEFWGFRTHLEAHYHWPDYAWHNATKVDLGGPENWKQRQTYADDLFTDKALDFIDAKAGVKPFFLYLAFSVPHKGISVPEDSQVPYRGLGWPKKHQPSGHYRNDADSHISYAGMISRMDGYLDRLRRKLTEKGIAENTLVIFTSDNGHEYDKDFFDSNGPFSGKKRSVTEGGIRMPTTAVWPTVIKPGSVIEEPLAFWDVLPTFCDLAGIKPTRKDLDGISFGPALRGDLSAQRSHEYLYWEFNEGSGPMQAIRVDNWKGIRHWNARQKGMGALRLYNLAADLPEKNNLAGSHPEVADRLTRMLANARTDHPQFPLTKRRRSK